MGLWRNLQDWLANLPGAVQAGLAVSIGLAKGTAKGPDYPDWSSRQKALDVIQTMTNLSAVQRPMP